MGHIKSQVWPAFWAATPYVLAAGLAWFGARQHTMTQSLAHARVHLTGFDAFLASVPSILVWSLFAAACVSGVIAFLIVLLRPPVSVTQAGVERGTDPTLLMKLDEEIRKREQAESERDTARQIKDHELGKARTVIQALEQQRDEASHHQIKWAAVTNFVVSYVRVTDLIALLNAAAVQMDARMPSHGGKGLTDIVMEFMRATEANEKDFAELRPKVIRVKTEVQAQHDLMDANLTDEKLTSPVKTPQQVREMIDGLETVALKLRNLIADAAVKAVDFKNQP